MKSVRELKCEIKDQIETICGIRRKINALKWKPGGQEALAKIRAERPRVSGKADLKEYRRPETGLERYDLWNEKRAAGDEARYLMLAYGAIRGRAYKKIEPKCGDGNAPSASRIWDRLADFIDPKLWTTITESAIEAWLSGKPLPIPPRPVRPEVIPAAMEASP